MAILALLILGIALGVGWCILKLNHHLEPLKLQPPLPFYLRECPE
jgi:hypothetical protein